MSKLSNFVKTMAELGHRRTRKNPRIQPRAKTKRFNVRQPTPIDPCEDQMLQKWWSDYRLQYSATTSLLQFDLHSKEAAETATERRDDEGERKRRLLLNKAWNNDTHVQSISHLKTILSDLTEAKQKRFLSLREAEKEKLDSVELRISALVTAIPHMITRENIDQKLEELFNSGVVDYNFVVDSRGNITYGSERLHKSEQSEAHEQGTTSKEAAKPDITSVRV
ncbi:unnamed protein product [Calicophoron daubneyi]|uniref:Small ribosomal subunit protein mS26 n=1 Tax=Calicophoron daubneyi TaxID=300641 RepID=A0AAV2TKM5_CALDB